MQFGPGVDPGLTVALRPYRQHVAGADFSAAVLDWFGIRGEAAFRYPLDYEDYDYAPNPEIQYVLGLDKEFFGELNFILQYTGKYVFDWDSIDDDQRISYLMENPSAITGPVDIPAMVNNEIMFRNRMISGQTERVQHGLTLRVEWKTLYETLSLSALGYYNISTGEWMTLPKITYQITDALQFSAGGQIYGGPDDTLYGMIDEIASAGYIEFKASF
jgi:hypothetical protein